MNFLDLPIHLGSHLNGYRRFGRTHGFNHPWNILPLGNCHPHRGWQRLSNCGIRTLDLATNRQQQASG
jgi:hypothetical protein